MVYKIEEIEGIGPSYAGKLNEAGVKTTDDLLDQAASASGRKDLAAKSGLEAKQILKWANFADLMRIKGVSGEYSELLEAAGVDTIKELRTRNAANLSAKIAEANEQKKLVRRLPTAGNVEDWIAQAKEMEPKISY